MRSTDLEGAVAETYRRGARTRVPELCCPVEYDARYVEAIPAEVLERDYGCGDPSRHVRPGETVLDLGSGSGKICFIAAQVVGAGGRVIGVDMTPEMLDVARRAAPVVAQRIGYANIEFRRGRIQDLALDLDLLDRELGGDPLSGVDGYLAARARAEELRRTHPLIPDGSIDVVISNCVLNLVPHEEKPGLFSEIHRVLRRGGRAVLSDIVSDEPVPAHLQTDPALWSGCISGALTENGFLTALENASLYGMRILDRQVAPWQTLEGIEFRSTTIEAFKGKEGPCLERRQAVIYRGPFKQVLDDDDHLMERGVRYAVCDKTFEIFRREPYREFFEFIEPHTEIPLEDAGPFDCSRTPMRHPRETKGEDYAVTADGPSCGPDDGCC